MAEPPKRFSTDEILKAFARLLSPLPACPMCRKDAGWAVAQNDGEEVMLPIQEALGRAPRNGVRTLGLQCLNCGFISLHSISRLFPEYFGRPKNG